MNSWGNIFRISIFGESHGESVGITIDGCPAGIIINPEDFAKELRRRKPGAKGTTARREEDVPLFASGIFNGKTTGAPLTILFPNREQTSKQYEKNKYLARPGHADLTARQKFGGYNDYRGGGQFSGRLTAPVVAAGVLAKKIIAPVDAKAELIEAGGSKDIEQAIQTAIDNNDSIGGIIECRISDVPKSLGEPFFNPVESALSSIIFSVPGIKGIEFGSGFKAAYMTGSEHNDQFTDGKGLTGTNHSGGISGGITNGNDIVFRVAVKPTPTIPAPQRALNMETGETEEIVFGGMHDTCFALRLPAVIESVAAIALADLMFFEQQRKRIFDK